MKKIILRLYLISMSMAYVLCAETSTQDKNTIKSEVENKSKITEKKYGESKDKESQIIGMKQIEGDNCLQFTPPKDWVLADITILPERVQMLAVGKGPSAFPPSLNLSSDNYTQTLKQYLKTVKDLNTSQGYVWKDLGSIQTPAGKGSLSQVDTQTTWGVVRFMHVIIVKNGRVSILTASALKDEFSLFYQDFFASMRTLRPCSP